MRKIITDYRTPELSSLVNSLEDSLVLAWKANDTQALSLMIDSLNVIHINIGEKRGSRTYVYSNGLLNIVK